MGKRIFAAILAATMALLLLPKQANAASVTEVYVGNTKLDASTPSTTAYGGTASFDAATGTLTLSGVSVPTSASYQINPTDYASIYADGDLKLVLIGANSATAPDHTSSNSNVTGLRVAGSLTVSGGGSLTATGGMAYQSLGIFVEKDVNVLSGTLKGISGKRRPAGFLSSFGAFIVGALNVSGGSITGESTAGSGESSAGIAAGGISLSGGSITGKGTGSTAGPSYKSCGILGFRFIKVTGGVMRGEISSDPSSRPTVAIGAEQLLFSGGQIVADASALANATAFLAQPAFGANPAWYQWRLSGSGAYTPSSVTPYTLEAGNNYVNIIPAAASIPKTGDSATPVLWLGIALLAILGLAGNRVALKKRRGK